MGCYAPLRAYRAESGEVVFREPPRALASLELPCGRCVGCRLARASSWSLRCQHEAQLYDRNCFVTLTYADNQLPPHGSLRYVDVQKMFKRLRRRFSGYSVAPDGRKPIRFFVAGEYGSQSWRPHYHALLFNFDFPDKVAFTDRTFRSSILEDLWPYGTSVVGSVTPASAAYVSQYALKKVYGHAGDKFYSWVDGRTGELCEVEKEFCVMSRKPGIGAWWLDRYMSDVLPRDYVVSGARKHAVPRYYGDRFSRSSPFEYERVKDGRFDRAAAMPLEERTPERRQVKAEVASAALSHFSNRRL